VDVCTNRDVLSGAHFVNSYMFCSGSFCARTVLAGNVFVLVILCQDVLLKDNLSIDILL